jgi:hypothetical protein
MDFHALLAKMKELDRAPVQAVAPVEQITQECGDPMGMSSSPMSPPGQQMPPPPAHPSMSVNLNAQGLDNIESMMKLFQKVNPDMMPKVSPSPIMSPMPTITGIKPALPPLKMLPDFDADNDMKIGGEMDLDSPGMPGDPSKMDMDDTPKIPSSLTKIDLDKPDMDLDKDDDKGPQPGGLGASLDRDGDGDHDMDDHDMEKDNDDSDVDSDDEEDDKKKDEDGGFQTATTKPKEKFSDIDYMTNKLSGGMNQSQGTYPKVAGGDNPMQKVKESEDAFRASIRADLQRRLNEAKGAK